MLLSQQELAKMISAVMWLSTEATCHSRMTEPCCDKLRAMQQYCVTFALGYLSSALVTVLKGSSHQPHHREAPFAINLNSVNVTPLPGDKID